MKNLLVLYCSLCSLWCYSQTTTFNLTFNDFYLADLRNIILYNDGYVAIGGGRELSNPNGKIKIIICNFDNNGNKIWDKTIGDENFNYYHGERNSLIKNFDGTYTLSGSRNISSANAGMLTKFDQNFDTLWTRLYFDNPAFTAFYNHIQTPDGGYALVGCIADTDPDGDVLLVKTDSEGNMEWYKKYGTSDRDIGLCIVETPDNGFLIGGECGLGNTDGYLVKTDSEGNQQWARNYGNPLYPDGTIYTIVENFQNEYIIPLTSFVTDPISEFFYNRKYNIIKLDSNFNQLWNKQYGTRAEHTSIATLTVTEYGEIWATVKDDNVVGLFRLSPDGDSISKHYYEPGESIGQRSLLSIKQTPDNGFIMAGVAYEPQVMWVVKTDSCGCVVEDCECGGSDVESFTKELEIEVYPNPASDFINIKWNEVSYDAVLSIFSLSGQELLSKTIIDNSTSLNISGLQSGFYIIQIKTKDKILIKKLQKI